MKKIKTFFKKSLAWLKSVPSKTVEWFKNWTKAKSALAIGLALVIFGGAVASMIQTNFFQVDVSQKTIYVSNGSVVSYEEAIKDPKAQWNVADIFKPKNASAENPVPMILVAPGIQRTKETQASFCIELVRRGFGVICMDPYGQGESSPSNKLQSATDEGYGLFHWMDYLYSVEGQQEFDWIDYSRIGATGHSAGGNGAQKLAEREGKLANDMKIDSRLNAVYITGFIRGWTWKTTTCNIGISYSANDEGAFQNETAIKKAEIQAKKDKGSTLTADEEFWLTVGNADMRYAPESIEIVNYQLARAGEKSISQVEVGVGYGNPYEGTYAIINNESCLHAMQPYDSQTLTNLVGFFGYVFDNYDANNLQNGIADNNQIWLFKEIGGGMALVGGFVFIMALAVLLLRTPAFASLKKPIPQRTGNQKVKGRIIFWLAFAISAVIACILYIVCGKLSVSWFADAAGGRQTWFFPQRFTNAVMMWAVANGLIGLAIFFITWGLEWIIDRCRAKKQALSTGVDFSSMASTIKGEYLGKLEPLKLKGSDYWKTPLFALILIVSFFALNWLIYTIFHVDMRFFFLSARVMFNTKSILAGLMYLPFFFIFYMSNSLRVNCSMRPSNWPEWLSQLISVLGNTVGLIGILFIQYIPFITTGTIGYTGTVGPEWLFVNMLFSIIPMMAALPLLNRYFFNKTGRAWVGAIVVCAIFILMTTSGTTIYYMI